MICLALLGGLVAYVRDQGGAREAGGSALVVEAPSDVADLPYYDSSWTFTDRNGTIEVNTDLYRDGEGRDFGLTICNLTHGAYGDVDVMVLGKDGGPLAHRFGNSVCERG